MIENRGQQHVKGEKILIVDDDLHMRIFMSTLFKTNGLNAIASKDGKEGIAEARKSAPSLIVLDLMMPGKGGIKMYQQLKTDEKLKNIPIVILSGVNTKTFFHSLNLLSAGSKEPLPEPEAYMEKPPKPEELLGRVQALLKKCKTTNPEHHHS